MTWAIPSGISGAPTRNAKLSQKTSELICVDRYHIQSVFDAAKTDLFDALTIVGLAVYLMHVEKYFPKVLTSKNIKR